MIARANSFKAVTLKQVCQRLAQLLRNGHTSAKERRQRSKVAGVPEVALDGSRQLAAASMAINQR